MSSALPPGFTLEETPGASSAALPPGFVLDALPPGFSIEPPRRPDTSVAQNVGVAARAAYPYATAAGLGAAAGAPFGGLPGAIAGASLAPLALGLSDIATTGYNVATPLFGGTRVPLPSENIQALYEYFGLGRHPETPGQEVLSAIVGGATGAGAQARGLNALAQYLSPSVLRNVMTRFSAQPTVQAGAGAGGAAAPTALREYGDVDDPYAGMAASLLGAVVGGRAVAGAGNVARGVGNTARMAVTPTPDALRAQATRAYTRAENAGVSYTPAAVQTFAQNLTQRLNLPANAIDPDLHPNASAVLRRVVAVGAPTASGGAAPVRFQDWETVRRVANDARVDRNASDADKRLAGLIVREIDNFVVNAPTSAVATGNNPAAAAAIREARSAWSRMRKSDEIEDLVERARLSATATNGRMDEALRSEFAALARSIQAGRNPGFTPAEVANIERIARAEGGRLGTRFFSQLAPGLTPRGMMSAAAQTGGMAAAGGDTTMAALAIPTMATGYGARLLRNSLGEFEANRLAAGMRRGNVTAPFEARARNLLSPTVQQMLLQSE
jgi:hypothetical protein